MAELCIAGDIGGTNSRLCLYTVPGGSRVVQGKCAPGAVVYQSEYKNESFNSFGDIMRQFFRDANISSEKPPLAACLAVAGPVAENTVILTNRQWHICGYELGADLGVAKFKLINDFVGQGYGLLTLSDSECTVLQDAPVVRSAPIACIGAGTGLGECFVTPTSDGFFEAWPSEGGHAEFAPRDDLEMELLGFLKNKFKEKHRVSVERVVSGNGLVNIYEFLRVKYPSRVDPAVDTQVEASSEAGGVVARNATPGSLCEQAIQMMMGAYGSEAGVAALKTMPFGGLYITGGITPKNIERIQNEPHFMHALRDKGRLSSMVARVPVKAVMVEDVGMRGAHLVAVKLLLDVVREGREGGGVDAASASTTRSAVTAWGAGLLSPACLAAVGAAAVIGYMFAKRGGGAGGV